MVASKIDNLLDKSIRKEVIPGVVLSIHRGDEVVYHRTRGYFTYDKMSPPVTLKTIYDIASVTKQIVATAALKLIDDQEIQLCDPINKYIPTLKSSNLKNRTIWNLLTHTSSIHVQLSVLPRQKLKRLIKDVLPGLHGGESPGKEVCYANINTFLLGKIIERVTSTSLEQFLKSEIFKPLEMNDTFFNPSSDIKSSIPPTEITKTDGVIQGVVHDESARRLGGVSGHAGIFSTVNDLNKFLSIWVNGGTFKTKRILSEKTLDQAITNQTPDLNLESGLGWHINDSNYLGESGNLGIFFHPGFTGSMIAGLVDKKFTLVFLSNATYPYRKDPNRKKEMFQQLFSLVNTDILKAD